MFRRAHGFRSAVLRSHVEHRGCENRLSENVAQPGKHLHRDQAQGVHVDAHAAMDHSQPAGPRWPGR